MGTTTNNGWTYPESTDLVKDGATAIQTLADDIDTTLGVYAPSSSGLTLINTTSFSAVASQSINDCFSTTYDNYKIFFNAIGSTDLDLDIRFRVSGADNSTANYNRQLLSAGGTTLIGGRAVSQTSGLVHALRTEDVELELTVVNPFKTARTMYHTQGYDSDTGALLKYIVGRFNLTTSFTGFTLICAGTMTGTLSVYGLAK